EQQLPINPSGTFHGEPGESSYRYEPETAFFKSSTDVCLLGHAWPPLRPATEVTVRLHAGLLRQTARVIGDRYWIKSLGVISMTPPEPFEQLPLTYERAFGGWDRSHPDPNRHMFELRNPLGTGFRSKHGTFEEGLRLPNLEDPRDLIREHGQTVSPIGFGF